LVPTQMPTQFPHDVVRWPLWQFLCQRNVTIMSNTSNGVCGASQWRGRVATILMLLGSHRCSVLFPQLDRCGGDRKPHDAGGRDMAFVWVLVFTVLFVILAFWPRRYPGVWELAIFRKVALTVSAVTLISGAAGTMLIVISDGLVAVFLIAAYLLARGYAGWTSLRTN
jgi:fermentation-respiration switch protein FrsA (DUF1100 family)